MAGTVDLDAILLELGQFGRYQIRNYCFILVVILTSAVYNAQYIFAAGDVPYRYAFIHSVVTVEAVTNIETQSDSESRCLIKDISLFSKVRSLT